LRFDKSSKVFHHKAKGALHMQKKHLALTVVLLFLSTLAFASPSKGWIGGVFGYQYTDTDFEFDLAGTTASQRIKEQSFVGGIEGACFFGKQRKYGLGYEVGFLIPQEMTNADGEDLLDDASSFGMVAAAYFTYRPSLSDKLSLDLGLGEFFHFTYVSSQESDDTYYALQNFGLSGKIGLLLQANPHLALRFGVRADLAILSFLDYQIDLGSLGMGSFSDTKICDLRHGFALAPFVGCAYSF